MLSPSEIRYQRGFVEVERGVFLEEENQIETKTENIRVREERRDERTRNGRKDTGRGGEGWEGVEGE